MDQDAKEPVDILDRKMAKLVWIDGGQQVAFPSATKAGIHKASDGEHWAKVRIMLMTVITKADPMAKITIHLRQ